MGSWILFGYWLLTLLGLLWVKRVTHGRLRCNIFSAALAAGIFVGIIFGITCFVLTFYQQMPKVILLATYLFMVFGLIPTASVLTLFLGKMLIPFFKIEVSDITLCTKYLTAWTFVALVLVSILKVFGFLLMGLLFGGGVPKSITRGANDEFYHY